MPTDLPLHPALVHIPLGLAVAMPFVAIGIAVVVWRGRLPRAALAIVAALQLLLAGSAFAALLAGERDADAAEKIAPRDAVEEHEEAGERVAWGALAVFALAAGAVFVPARRATLASALVAAGTLVVAAFAVDAGRKGGELVFRYGAGRIGAAAPSSPGAAPPAAPASAGAPARDDDD